MPAHNYLKYTAKITINIALSKSLQWSQKNDKFSQLCIMHTPLQFGAVLCSQYPCWLFGTCLPLLGWAGWGCTDNSEAYSYGFQLLSTLLLCLSNLMFVPPVAIAIRSHYLLEAAVYIFTMFFSTVSKYRRCGYQPLWFFLGGSGSGCEQGTRMALSLSQKGDSNQ